jgi:hypothetical protein
MTVRSWMVRSWPQIDWTAPASDDGWPRFQHMGTEVRAERDHEGRVVGDTVWAAMMEDKGVIGAAWEWVELLPGVITLSDPNALVSNARFVTREGACEEELLALVHVNRIAHSIPWQQAVAQALRERSDAARLPRRPERRGAQPSRRGAVAVM